jgi:hypothetical protein
VLGSGLGRNAGELGGCSEVGGALAVLTTGSVTAAASSAGGGDGRTVFLKSPGGAVGRDEGVVEAAGTVGGAVELAVERALARVAARALEVGSMVGRGLELTLAGAAGGRLLLLAATAERGARWLVAVGEEPGGGRLLVEALATIPGEVFGEPKAGPVRGRALALGEDDGFEADAFGGMDELRAWPASRIASFIPS